MTVDAEPNTDGRSARRYEVELDGTIRAADWRPVDVQLEDLSATGCRLTGAAGLHVGDTLTIGVLGAGMRSARVVRQADGKLGCEFDEPLTAAELENALARPAFVVVSLAAATPGSGTDPASDTPSREGGLAVATRLAGIAAAALVLWALFIVAVRLLVRTG